MDESDKNNVRDLSRSALDDALERALQKQLSLMLPPERRRLFYVGITYMAMAPLCVAIGLIPLNDGNTGDFALWVCGGLLLLTLGVNWVKRASTEENKIKRRLKKQNAKKATKTDEPPQLRRVK